MLGIERGVLHQSVIRNKSGAGFARNTLGDSPIWINRGRHSGVRVTQQPAGILHGAHARLLQMLSVCTTVPVPAVVRDVHEYFCAIPRELPYLVRENGFVTDKYAQFLFPRL